MKPTNPIIILTRMITNPGSIAMREEKRSAKRGVSSVECGVKRGKCEV